MGESGQASAGAPRTVAEALGQIAWLFTQSALHRELKLKDLEWSVMPALLAEQFRIFRFGPLPGISAEEAEKLAPLGLSKAGLEQLPLGVALWARLSEAAEAKLERGERLEPAEWNSGDRTWLVELISPFATEANKLSQAMMLDLLQGPFAGKVIKLHRTDLKTGERKRVEVREHLVQAEAAESAG